MLKVKVTTVGNSVGITFPKEALGYLNVAKGDYLYLVKTHNGYELTPYDQEFLDQMIWAEQIMEEDRDVLRVFFGCPDCECSEFNINLAAEAFCAECGLQILMVVEDDIQ